MSEFSSTYLGNGSEPGSRTVAKLKESNTLLIIYKVPGQGIRAIELQPRSLRHTAAPSTHGGAPRLSLRSGLPLRDPLPLAPKPGARLLDPKPNHALCWSQAFPSAGADVLLCRWVPIIRCWLVPPCLFGDCLASVEVDALCLRRLALMVSFKLGHRISWGSPIVACVTACQPYPC